MRFYECECLQCHRRTQVRFDEPYPELGTEFQHACRQCGAVTSFTRVLTRKALAERRRQEEEEGLKRAIMEYGAGYGFQCRFLYESVIIYTPVSSWSFGYHERLKTLRHESTVKINFKTGDYARTHEQFANRKMTCFEVIDYIAEHDKWRQEQAGLSCKNQSAEDDRKAKEGS